MKKMLFVLLAMTFTQIGFTQTNSNQSPDQEEIVSISKKKWNWMSEKIVDSLDQLFHENLCLYIWEEAGENPKN